MNDNTIDRIGLYSISMFFTCVITGVVLVALCLLRILLIHELGLVFTAIICTGIADIVIFLFCVDELNCRENKRKYGSIFGSMYET